MLTKKTWNILIEGSIIAIDDVTWCHNLAIPQFFGE